MCELMLYIQSATAEKDRKKIEETRLQDENIMACPIPYGGHG